MFTRSIYLAYFRGNTELAQFWFLYLLVWATFLFLRTAFFTVKGHLNLTYHHLPEPKEMQKHRKEVEDYYNNPVIAEEKLSDELTDLYLKSTQTNHELNEKRIGHILNAKTSVVVAFIFLFFAAIIHMADQKQMISRRRIIEMSADKPAPDTKPIQTPTPRPQNPPAPLEPKPITEDKQYPNVEKRR